MKGYIPVEIPTKRYIKAYIHFKLGEKPFMNTECNIGSKLYDVLNHKTNEEKTRFSNVRYNSSLRLYVSYHTFRQRGAFLNETNIRNFNLYVEGLIKDRFRLYMDFYISILPSFEANLPEVRKNLGIDIEEWSDDSMRKDYYRYRLYTGKPLFYDKKNTATVPSAINLNFGF